MTPVSIPAALSPSGPASLPLLQPGATMQGLVQQLIGGSAVRLQLPMGTLDVAAATTLAAGSRVQIAVQGTPAQPKLMLTPLTAQGSPAGMAVPARLVAVARTALPVAPAPGPAADAPKSALQAALASVVRDAAGRQGGLAPLMADLEAALSRPGANLPQPVREAAAQLLAQRLDLRAPLDAQGLKQALAASGLAADGPGVSHAAGLVAALAGLRRVLAEWKSTLPQTPAPDRTPAQTASTPRPAVPAPPHRNASPVAQPPALPALPDDADPHAIASHLAARTEAAMARQTLLQAASLPDMTTGEPAKSDAASPRVTLDVPLASVHGNAVAQIRIERDAHQAPHEAGAPAVWRVNFSIDIEPVGPVHAAVALVGERAAITLRAERSDSAARLREGLPLLEAGLKAAALEPGELVCRTGRPPAQPAAPGRFVDQAS